MEAVKARYGDVRGRAAARIVNCMDQHYRRGAITSLEAAEDALAFIGWPQLLENLRYIEDACGISDPDLAALAPDDILDVRITAKAFRDIRNTITDAVHVGE